MAAYTALTAFIPALAEDSFGEWSTEEEIVRAGAKGPWINYTPTTQAFLFTLDEVAGTFPEGALREEIRACGIEYSTPGFRAADLQTATPEALIAMMWTLVNVEHLREGNLLRFFKEGWMLRWLTRLAELDV